MPPYLIVILVCGVFMLIGGGLIWLGLRTRKLAAASKSWPAARGKILNSAVRKYESTDSDGRNSVRYQAQVEYEYTAGEKTSRGSRIQFGLSDLNSSAAAQAIVNRYPVGAEVNVFYDPAQPAQCTLEQTASGAIVVLFIIGAAFLIIAPCTGTIAFLFRE